MEIIKKVVQQVNPGMIKFFLFNYAMSYLVKNILNFNFQNKKLKKKKLEGKYWIFKKPGGLVFFL